MTSLRSGLRGQRKFSGNGASVRECFYQRRGLIEKFAER